jgi:probable rRNA maturation factor
MIRIRVFKTSNYPISTPKIKKDLKTFLQQKGIVSDAEISLAFIGKDRMKKLVDKYLKEKDSIHNVLSFTENEVNKKFIYPPGTMICLGEVVVCFPKAIEEAKEEDKLIHEKVWELVEHGTMHLLGIHHK